MDFFKPLRLTWSPQGITLCVLSALSLLVCCPPLAWHIKNRNFPASCLIIWVIIDNIFNFINPLIWPTDYITSWWSGVGLCDVETKLMMGSYVGIVGALACIFRSLAAALDTDSAVLIPSKAERRRKFMIELALCIGFPIYMMVTHYIIQPHRYMIYAINGCSPSYDQSWPSTALHFIWPPVLCLVDVYYCVIVVYRLNKYRHQFADILMSSGSDYNRSRFIRLFVISALMLLVNFPVQLYVLYRNVSFEWLPYSWSEIHAADWGRIEKLPSYGEVAYHRWIQVAAGYFLFAFFGFGSDATLMYRAALLKIGLGRWFPALHHPHISEERKNSSSSRFGSIGSRAKFAFRRKHESMQSISSGSSRQNKKPGHISMHSPRDVENCPPSPDFITNYTAPGNPTAPDPVWRPFTLGTLTHNRFPQYAESSNMSDETFVPRSRFSSESVDRLTNMDRLASVGSVQTKVDSKDRNQSH
ncbi:a-factor receptor [Arachnomyces sp. PD_36]|nr:a-factor receptor [Arachnomyces sp. PD_36]